MKQMGEDWMEEWKNSPGLQPVSTVNSWNINNSWEFGDMASGGGGLEAAKRPPSQKIKK